MTGMAELRELSDADLRARENELDEEIFRVRMNQGKEHGESPYKIRQLRRDRARIKTLMRERELASEGNG